MYDLRLINRLLESKPSLVVLVGEPVFRLNKALNQVVKETQSAGLVAQTSQVEQVKRIERYIDTSTALERNIADCVMCLDLPINTSDPQSLLGLACRASPRLLLVEQTSSESSNFLLADEQFFAFGFRVVEKTADSGLQRALYAYSLSDYKQAPDWLNAKFWARPERFDLLE